MSLPPLSIWRRKYPDGETEPYDAVDSFRFQSSVAQGWMYDIDTPDLPLETSDVYGIIDPTDDFIDVAIAVNQVARRYRIDPWNDETEDHRFLLGGILFVDVYACQPQWDDLHQLLHRLFRYLSKRIEEYDTCAVVQFPNAQITSAMTSYPWEQTHLSTMLRGRMRAGEFSHFPRGQISIIAAGAILEPLKWKSPVIVEEMFRPSDAVPRPS